MEAETLKLPGFGLPINHINQLEDPFPHALRSWTAGALSLRELTMLHLMNNITDKPDWATKVFDEQLIQKWGQEAIDAEGMDVTDKMLDSCFAELQHKALSFKETGIVLALDGEVAVAKSDTIISDQLNKALRSACAPLESVSEKDWHPGSDQRVLDLVHPSLFPLVYGRSRVLPSGKVDLKGCEDFVGRGRTAQRPKDKLEPAPNSPYWNRTSDKFWSRDFQWLPCDVSFDDNGVKITSYINNLHPGHHTHLYSAIERVIDETIPLWDNVLSSVLSYSHKSRIEMQNCDYEWPKGKDVPEDYVVPEDERDEDEEDEVDEYEKQERWEKSTRVLILPEPGDFKPPTLSDQDKARRVNLKTKFADTGLQIIVKLANIELTPEKPTYDGGSWHVEGQLNEHICASALYYYSSENITDSFLSFRQRVDNQKIEEQSYGQDDYEGVEQIYGIEQHGPAIQELGSILTKQGRLIAFPNVLQHRVSPFRLQDSTKPGHRKILALFLVDPQIRIISTANVPPQQQSWLTKETIERSNSLLERTKALPNELVDNIVADIPCSTMSMEEAKELRLKLMEERKAFVEAVDRDFEEYTFSFCEH